MGKFENLQEDFNRVCERIGMPVTRLPHVNKSKPGNTGRQHRCVGSYMEYYDTEAKEFVAELYKQDIEAFDYQFGDVNPAIGSRG